jgi:hypothetical protein
MVEKDLKQRTEEYAWLELLTEGEIISKDQRTSALMQETEELLAIFLSIKIKHKS